MPYAQHFSTLTTPQTEPASSKQVENSAGGFSFAVDKWARLDRFLILGAEGGTYYATEKALTVENAKGVLECIAEDGTRTVARIVDVSDRGLAPKNDAAIFALAIAAGAEDAATRTAALAALPEVCRIGTHLFHFVRDVEGFRRWGRSLRTAVAAWYTAQPVDKLAQQLVKYRQRDGWSHRDVLRLSHPKAPTAEHQALFRYAIGGAAALGQRDVKRRAADKSERVATYPETSALPPFILAFEEAQSTDNEARLCTLIREHHLTHEMLPTEWKTKIGVWEALLDSGMPLTALTRNLGKMTQIGLLKPLAAATRQAVATITDAAALRKARLHPLTLLTALKTYQQGHGDKGSLTWTPEQSIVDALDAAFYMSFDTIEPTGKNLMLALDVSGSMTWVKMAGSPLTPRDASAAMAMVTARVEKNSYVMGFSSGLVPIPISPRQRLDDVIRTIERVPAGSTDCSLPMVHAMAERLDVDGFFVYTDSETYAGRIHPHQALKQYRQQSGRGAKLVVCGMVSNGFTVADPSDAGMLDVVGFSTDTPAAMSNFIRG